MTDRHIYLLFLGRGCCRWSDWDNSREQFLIVMSSLFCGAVPLEEAPCKYVCLSCGLPSSYFPTNYIISSSVEHPCHPMCPYAEPCLYPIMAMAAPCRPDENRGATPLDDMPHAAEGRKAAARAPRMEQKRLDPYGITVMVIWQWMQGFDQLYRDNP